jgi:hypothetical protein
MKRVVVWQRVDTVGAEYAEIELEPLRFEGNVVFVESGDRGSVSYRVECDDAAMTSRAFIRYKREGTAHECNLVRSGEGFWTVNGILAPQLQGLADVDLSVTPSTNTPPLRRLRLAIGQYAEVTAAWVRFPALDVVRLRQVYRRVGANGYVYEAPDVPFAADLECDEDGIVRTYGGLWRECS